jgi:hypothetical protein
MTSQPTTGNGGLSLKSWTLIVWGLYLASFFSLATTQIMRSAPFGSDSA